MSGPTRKGIVFRTNGGFGKQLCGTVVAKQIKEKYPDIPLHVQTSYPTAFTNLKFIEKVYPFQPLPDFYDLHEDFEVLEFEPYIDFRYRKGLEHLTDVWCRRLGLDLPKSKTPLIELRKTEIDTAKAFFAGLRLSQSAKVVALQYVGGTSFYDQRQANDPSRVKHYRDLSMETAQDVVKKLAQKGIICLHIGLPTEKPLEGCITMPNNNGEPLPPRFVMAILAECAGGIFIDSFAQHAWTGLGKKNAVVLWGGTRPTSLGYSDNNNLIGICDKIGCGRPDTFMHDINGDNSLWECPHNAKCMKFKPDEIVEACIASLEKNSPKPPDAPLTDGK